VARERWRRWSRAVAAAYLSALFLAAPAGSARPSAAARLVGRPAPAFTLRQLDGGRLSLSALRGKVVLLAFWTPG
jgi:hypothetical protein